MPNWKLHNKWAESFGIDKKISSFINMREDRPEIDTSLTKDKSLKIKLENIPDVPPTINEITKLGKEYLNAWILHLILDEIEDTYEYLTCECKESNDINEAIIDIVLGNPFYRLVPNDIQDFIKSNIELIIEDIKESDPTCELYGI